VIDSKFHTTILDYVSSEYTHMILKDIFFHFFLGTRVALGKWESNDDENNKIQDHFCQLMTKMVTVVRNNAPNPTKRSPFSAH